MRSDSSKPSSDAGLRAIGGFSSLPPATDKTASEILGCGLSFTDKQTAVEGQPCHLPGRHKAPTRGPTQWGGEGTTVRPKTQKERLQWMADNLPGFREELEQANAIRRQFASLRT